MHKKLELNKFFDAFKKDSGPPGQRAITKVHHRNWRHNVVKMWPQDCKLNRINVKTGTKPYSWPYLTHKVKSFAMVALCDSGPLPSKGDVT